MEQVQLDLVEIKEHLGVAPKLRTVTSSRQPRGLWVVTGGE